jgi:hypothetical protein
MVQIIVKSKEPESARRSREAAQAQRRHYYNREINQGARFRSKAGTKEQIRKALDEAD